MRKTLNDFIRYIYRKYPAPKIWWSKAHYERRCTEIYVAEQVILRCMDSPFTDPKDIIDDYQFTIMALRSSVRNPDVLRRLNFMIFTLDMLYKFFE